jgi:type IV pilus assembly protein PilY1
VTQRRNNELWAFVPPAILPHLPSQYPATHQVLLDGVPVVKDVVAMANPLAVGSDYKFKLERTVADAQAGTGTWRTILVQSFGAERPGYFAMDVTDPIAVEGDPSKGPRFLWQLTNDVHGHPLFGSGGTTPAITTVFIGNKEVAVAVLPGGRGSPGGAGAGSGCARQTTDFSAIDTSSPWGQPRANVPCYTGAGTAARSLTIVRLDTGEIIKSFRRATSEIDLPVDRISVAKLDSPITGQPVAYPSGTGAVADRIFVGDHDGALWRVDLSSPNPASWQMTLFFDTFTSSLAGAYNAGQPIVTPPVVSVDLRGNLTINVSTGDQDAIGASSTMKNYVWSLTEEPVLFANGDVDSFKSKVNWYRELTGGERVTGPLVLFNSSLFFSTFKPPAAGSPVCSVGTSAVWGMHYLTGPLGAGGVPAKNVGGAPTQALGGQLFILASNLLGQDNAAIFGVSLAQTPTCSTSDDSEIDQYLGYGTGRAITEVTPGTFQLVMHTGSVGPSAGGGPVSGVSSPSGSDANAVAIDLPTPPTSSRIDSWAAIVE